MAAGAIVNAVWDLSARDEGKPVWRLLSDMSPEDFVSCADLRYVSDVLTRDEAVAIVARNAATRGERIAYLEQHGYPAYTTSAAGSDTTTRNLYVSAGNPSSRAFGISSSKVGQDLDDDIRRCRLARQTIGPGVALMIDADQAWEVDQAIAWVRRLADFEPWFIEEPTSPDDVMGHRKIREGIGDIGWRPASTARTASSSNSSLPATRSMSCRSMPAASRASTKSSPCTSSPPVRQAGLSARRRRGALRVRAAYVDDRLRHDLGRNRRTRHRVRRSPARTLRRSLRRKRRGLPRARCARLQRADAAGILSAFEYPNGAEWQARLGRARSRPPIRPEAAYA